jgi:hypothetical protein
MSGGSSTTVGAKGEELAGQTGGPLAPRQYSRAGGLRLREHGFESFHLARHAHGANVHPGIAVGVQRGALPHPLGRGGYFGHKVGQQRGVNEVAFTPEAVLAGRAETGARGGLEGGGDVGAGEEDQRVLAAQF